MPKVRLFPVDQIRWEAGFRPKALKMGTKIMATSPQAKPVEYRFMPFWMRKAYSDTGAMRKPMSKPTTAPSQGDTSQPMKLTMGAREVPNMATLTYLEKGSFRQRA